jgi:hypothetical protein
MDMGRALHRRLWAAILTAFLFMLRRREDLAEGGGKVDHEQILLLGDVTFRRGGTEHPLHADGEPDEVLLRLRKSKTGPYGKGATRNHYCNEQEEFSVVRTLWRHCREAWALGAQPGRPAFCGPKGKVLACRGALGAGAAVAARSQAAKRGGTACSLALTPKPTPILGIESAGAGVVRYLPHAHMPRG